MSTPQPQLSLHLRRSLQWLGSLQVAVPLLIVIAMVLAWGTLYEARFGTAAVQQFIYHAWWFQALLGFLAVNLAIAAGERYPWTWRQAPFVLAHIGIIFILLGGIIGGRWGIEGQLIIPQGQSERLLQLPTNVLVVHQPNPGVHRELLTNFEATAWNHAPQTRYQIPLSDRAVTLTVDAYYPDAVSDEIFTEDDPHESPALQVKVRSTEPEGPMADAMGEAMWLLARDPERFGARWGEAHLLFLEPQTPEQAEQLLGRSSSPASPRGTVNITFADGRTVSVPVPQDLSKPAPVPGTPYTVTFKDYFPDFTLTERGPASRSDEPNNPAVALTLSGPEGTDAHLLFALHPDFASIHGRTHVIPAQVQYVHAAASVLPPHSFSFLRRDAKTPALVMTGRGGERQVVEAVEIGRWYRHPSMGYEAQAAAEALHGRLTRRFSNRSDELHSEAVHVTAQDGSTQDGAWLGLREQATLAVGREPIVVEYRPAQRELPVVLKLLHFRKIDYPGTDMAAGYEADVQLSDPDRGLILVRKITMNNPLRYRGFSFYQSSYVPGETATTVLSVKNDPGTPLVYAGFLIVIAGVIGQFVTHPSGKPASAAAKKGGRRTR